MHYDELMGESPRSHGSFWRRLFRGVFRLIEPSDAPAFAATADAEKVLDLTVTDRFHTKQGRSTARHVLPTPTGDVTVYLKRHYRLPRRHGILATLFPKAGWSPAMHEWQHLQWARSQGLPVPRPVAAAEYIGPWGRLRSFLAVEELTDMLPLHLAIPAAAAQLPAAVFARWKRSLVIELARLARALHDRRYFHKDLYLCHFYIHRDHTLSLPGDWTGRVFMIDFHRLQRHRWTWPLWQSKDLAELLFSSEIVGVTARDRIRFWRAYVGTRRHGFFVALLRRLILFKWHLYQRHNRKLDRRKPSDSRLAASA
jgi:heptose I phosphotransferase